jgi:hypothetical protein
MMKRTVGFRVAMMAALLVAVATLSSVRATAQTAGPNAQELLGARRDVEDWLLPAHGYGTLAPQQYAAIVAYLLASNCVQPAGGGSGTTRFPNADQPAFKTVTLAGAGCPVK